MPSLRLRPALALLALAATLPFAACGDGNDPRAEGETEAVYVTTGGLRYQVQVSRKLNPYDVEDRDYFVGIKAPGAQVANPTDAWYGVFLRVENRTGLDTEAERTFRTASHFELSDNEGNTVEPTPFPAENIFAYRPQPLPAKGVLPLPSSNAAQSPIGGNLVLFKVDQQLLERRPVRLHIKSDDGTEAEVKLDI